MSVLSDIDPQDLAQAGWALVLPVGGSGERRAALGPLLEWRRTQAGERYRELEYRPGERATDFLARYGVGLDTVDPARLPYYLLLVGGPEEIPLRVQQLLAIQFAVGRVGFTTPQEYRRYAEGVLQTEQSASRPAPGLTVFAPTSPDEQPSRLLAEGLTGPLVTALTQAGTSVTTILGAAAHKERLRSLLNDAGAPALLFCAGHGVGFPAGDPRQPRQQGDLLCADWPGPGQPGPLAPGVCFGADDVGAAAALAGRIVLLYASYSAATPADDQFTSLLLREKTASAQRPIVASLAQRLLSCPGGALAVVGMAERAWFGAVAGDRLAREQVEVYTALVRRLLNGRRIGAAMEVVVQRFAVLAADLSGELEEIAFGKQCDAARVLGLWTSRSDLGNMIVLGDPAVRLNR